MPELAQLPDLDAAMARLEAAEAVETAPPAPAFEQVEGDPNSPTPPAGEQGEGVATPSDLPDEGTQAAADEQAPAPKVEDAPATPPAKKQDEKPATDKANSFAKDKQRRDDSWKKLNEEKATLQQERATIQAERQRIERERQELAEEKAQATTRYTPEQYESSAQNNAQKAATLELQADGLEKRADAAEDNGNVQDARDMRAQAAKLRRTAAYHDGLAEQLKAEAKFKRENPDPTEQAIEQKRAHELREYTMNAAGKWPEVFKQGSPLNNTVAEHLKAAREVGLDVKKFPVLIYHAARLTAAEAAAARVPSLTKELGELRAKVKELEAFTSPGGGLESPAQLHHERPLSDEEEAASLRTTAQTLS